MTILCEICGKSFSSQSTHNRHAREVHQKVPDPVVWSNCCLEQDCNEAFRTGRKLMDHLEQVHLMKFQIESCNMNNLNDFEKWKREIENSNKCSYVLKNKYSSTMGERFHYYCNRSKTSYVPNDIKHRSRLQKSQGSCKMNNSCTSYIKVINEDGKILVEWQKVHYGHTLDLQHIRLPKLQKQSIASKLINGVTPRRILESTRDNLGEHLNRIDLLTSKDIRNIKTSYGVESQDGKRHSNDAFSVDLWVQECEALKESPVLLYKPQGKVHGILQEMDFCLIVMNKFQRQMLLKFSSTIAVDGTHGLNAYDFEMTTVMVIDEFHHGFPVAMMFSNRKDTMIQNIFFTLIRETVGKVTTKIFMSDMAESYFNAWAAVMGIGAEHLFCAWHVDKAWQNNLSKIPNKEKRAEVYKIIKTLQEHTSIPTFLTSLNNAVSHICGDEETKSFGDYFKNTYGHNFKKWAYCFRKDSTINTNMHLESMHKVLKYSYLERKTVRRLDKGLNAVLKYIRDKSVERLVRLTKGEHTKQTKMLTHAHKNALESSDSYVVTDCSTYYTIKNSRDVSYTVCQILENKCCEQICLFCKVCTHMYTCECDFYTERRIMCKHIHIIITKLNLHGSKNEEIAPRTSMLEDVLALSYEPCQSSKKILDTKMIRDLITKLENVSYEELDDAVISQIHQHLLIINNLSNCPKLFKDNDEFDVKNPSRKRVIDPQIRFTSTKKKRIETKTSLKRGTKQEILNIQEDLQSTSQDSSIFKSILPSNDHDYC